MAKLGSLDYDQEKYDRNAEHDFTPLPDGKYAVEVIHTEQKKWDDGGLQIKIRLEVIAGDKEGRIIFDDISIHSPDDIERTHKGRKNLHRWTDIAQQQWPLEDDELLLGARAIVTLKTFKKSGEKDSQHVVARSEYQPGNQMAREAKADRQTISQQASVQNRQAPQPNGQAPADNGMPF